MPRTLVIHAPSTQKGKKSYTTTIKTRTGSGYLLNKNILPHIGKHSPVIVLDRKSQPPQASKSTIIAIRPVVSGKKRFNISMRRMKTCAYGPYSKVLLNRNGVAVI